VAGASPPAPGTPLNALAKSLLQPLSSVAERFRGGAHLRGEAARLSGEAAKIGTDTLRRLSHSPVQRSPRQADSYKATKC
jgi:hypothetical protein